MRQPSPRWLIRDDVATATCATRIVQVAHVGRHYALAVPPPASAPSAARPGAPSSAGIGSSPNAAQREGLPSVASPAMASPNAAPPARDASVSRKAVAVTSSRGAVDDEITTIGAPRAALPSHVSRHYAFALPPPTVTNVRVLSTLAPSAGELHPLSPPFGSESICNRNNVVAADGDAVIAAKPVPRLTSVFESLENDMTPARENACMLPTGAPASIGDDRTAPTRTYARAAARLRDDRIAPTHARAAAPLGDDRLPTSPQPPAAAQQLGPTSGFSSLGDDRMLPTSAREPVDVDAARFIGATIQLFDVEVLVVQVAPRVISDRGEAPALVAAFESRFKRTIVLVAQDHRGIPTFFGPGPIAKVLSKIPFEALAWKRYRYRPPRPMMLPIPIDPPRDPSESFEYAYDSDGGDGYGSVDRRAVATRDLGAKPRADRSGGRPPGTPTRSLSGTTHPDSSSQPSANQIDVRSHTLGGTTHPDTDQRSTDRGIGIPMPGHGTSGPPAFHINKPTQPSMRRTQTLVREP